MVLNQHRRAIKVFHNYQAAIQALDGLIIAGFSPTKIFVVGQSTLQNDATLMRELVNQARAGAIAGTSIGLTKGIVLGNALGGMTGLLLGLGILALPGVGQVMLLSAIIFMVTSGTICMAAGGLIGALIGLGMTERQATEYGKLVCSGNYLLIVDGTEEEIHRAEHTLNALRIRKTLNYLEDA